MAMPDNSTVSVLLKLPAKLFAEVIEYRHDRRLPSRTEAMRRLLKRGLDAERPIALRADTDA